MKKAVLKWSLGVFSTLLVSLLIWYFTKPGGVLNPEVKKKSELVLAEMKIDSKKILVGRSTKVKVEIYNNGEVIATKCKLKFRIDGKIWHVEDFNVKPKSSYKSEFDTPKFKEEGEKIGSIYISSNGANFGKSSSFKISVDKCKDQPLKISNVEHRYTISKSKVFSLSPYISNNCFAKFQDLKLYLKINGNSSGKSIKYGFFSNDFDIESGKTHPINVASKKPLPKGAYVFEIILTNSGYPIKSMKGKLRVK